MNIKKTLKVIGLLIIIVIIFLLSWVKSNAEEIETEPLTPPVINYTTNQIESLVNVYADKYDVPRSTMQKVVSHESSYVWDTVGDNGTSFGVAQIHLPDHSDITKKQAMDPNYSLDWMAKNIKAGKGQMWTGYRVCILGQKVVYQGQQIKCLAKY